MKRNGKALKSWVFFFFWCQQVGPLQNTYFKNCGRQFNLVVLLKTLANLKQRFERQRRKTKKFRLAAPWGIEPADNGDGKG